MWTSRAYDHSTLESGVKWVGGDTSTRFEKTLAKVNGENALNGGGNNIPENCSHNAAHENYPIGDISARSQPTHEDYSRKSRNIISRASRAPSRMVYEYTTDHTTAATTRRPSVYKISCKVAIPTREARAYEYDNCGVISGPSILRFCCPAMSVSKPNDAHPQNWHVRL